MSENNSPTKLGAGAGTIAANPLFQPPSDGDADPHLGVAVAGAVAVAPAAKAKANSAAAAFQRLSDRQQQGSSPFTVEYDAGPVGLGFKSASMEGKIVPGIIVKNVVSDGPSDRWGLIEIGDRVVRVNETDLSDKVMSTCDKACATAAIRALKSSILSAPSIYLLNGRQAASICAQKTAGGTRGSAPASGSHQGPRHPKLLWTCNLCRNWAELVAGTGR